MDGEDDQPTKNAHKHDERGAADLERVTDFVEEKELAVSGVENIPGLLVSSDKTRSNASGPEGVLKLRKEDVELIVNELEVSKLAAEKKLREHRGNVKETIKDMLKL